MQAQRAAEDVGKKLPGAGDVTSAAKNAVPALPKVSVHCVLSMPSLCGVERKAYAPRCMPGTVDAWSSKGRSDFSVADEGCSCKPLQHQNVPSDPSFGCHADRR